jgi:hypothetical protein
MALRRPPQHAADATPLYIVSFDDAWDLERVKRERKAMKAEHPEAEHPRDAYYLGRTRYDIDAPCTIGGVVVTVRQYLREGSTPTVFHLRRVDGRRRTQALAVWADPRERVAAQWDLARHGVTKVTEGFEGKAWPLEGGAAGLPLTDDDLQQLFDVNDLLPQLLGIAVLNASAPLSDSEGKR